jgi:hypothetical protein
MPDKLLDEIVGDMVDADAKTRIKILESMSELHLVSFVTWLGTNIMVDHVDHADDCPYKNPKELVDKYVECFAKDLEASVEATCLANGVQYVPDPNKEVRDEILAQGDS